ncbi:hypothetical protein AgCh_032080 [Apium graveolens]
MPVWDLVACSHGENPWQLCLRWARVSDREYTPGHDSLKNSENEEVPTKIEKVQKVKAVTKPSTHLTRSQTLNNVTITHELEQEAKHVIDAEEEDLGKIDDTVVIVTDTTKPKRRRGPSKMNRVFTRKLEDRPTKYIIPEEGKGWVLRTMDELWRIHKSRVKAIYYTKYSTDVERLQNRPASIPLEKFKVLLEYWGDEDVHIKAVTNAENWKKVTDVHNAGRTSFTQIGKNMVKGDAAETGGDSEAEEVQLDFDGC